MATKRFYPATLENQKTIIDAVKALQNQAYPVGKIAFHVKKNFANYVVLRFKDPDNVVRDNVYFSYWEKTVIVRKYGSAPENIDDGVVVLENRNRNAYEDNGYIDNPPLDGDKDISKYEYRAFTFATNGRMNDDADQVFTGYTLFGYTIDEQNPDENTAVTYTDECADFSRLYYDYSIQADDGTGGQLHWGDWEHAFFMPRPCALGYDGEVKYYLDPNDYTKKADGTASDVANSAFEGNFMMEWPRVFTKFSKEEGLVTVKISDVKVDENFECYPCLKADGSYAEHWYTPIYEGVNVSGRLRSYASGGKPTASTTSANEAAYAAANGHGWDCTWWADEQTIIALGYLVLGRLNIEAALSPARTTASSLQINCGSGNKSGMFYGIKNPSRYVANKFFGMENWFNHRWRRPRGIVLSDQKWLVKMTPHMADGSTGEGFVSSDQSIDYSHYIKTGDDIESPSYNGAYITEVYGDKHSAFCVKRAVGGSSTTFYSDACYSASGFRGLLLGGAVNNGSLAGLLASTVTNAPSAALWYYGASLSFHQSF